MPKKNILIQFTYQLIILLIPLIISPYLSRHLGAESIGEYTYYNSIAQYFVIFANLGIVTYGTRIIAEKKIYGEKEVKKTFCELFALHFILSICAIFFYGIYLVVCLPNINIVQIIQYGVVVACLFDVTWLFQGLENFFKIAIRNLLVKLCELVMIVCFVKNTTHGSIYTIIMTASILLGNLLLFFDGIRTIGFQKVGLKAIFSHFKLIFILGLAAVSVSLYTVLDKTIIGFYLESEFVAYYDYAEKIVKIPVTVISALGTVMLPRITFLYGLGDTEKIKSLIRYSIIIVSFLSFGCLFGLLSVAYEFIPLYYGESFSICADYLVRLVPIIVLIPLGNIAINFYLVPMKKDKYLLATLIINAIINLLLNLLLINKIGVNGAIIGTIAAESLGLILQMGYSMYKLKIWMMLFEILPFLIIGLCMYFILLIIPVTISSPILSLLLKCFLGFIIYLSISLLYLIIFRRNIIKTALHIVKK